MKNGWRTFAWGCVVVVVLTMVTYWPALRGGFIWDDGVMITENPMVKAPDGLYRFWFTAEAADYQPVTSSLWWLEWRLWGDHAAGYHVVNVLLHAIDAILVWVLLRRLKIPGAWLAGLVFALHPVNAASVAWIIEQKNTLSMLLFAFSILIYLKFDEENRWRWYALSWVVFLAALLTKTAIVMEPLVLLLCVWWRHGRCQRKDFLRYAPFLVPCVVMGLVTIVQQQRLLAGESVRTGGAVSRLVTAGWIPWFYLSKALLPVNLMMIYPKWELDASRWSSYVPGMALVVCFALFWWNRKTWGRPLLFGFGYFVVMLFPVLGFFDQGFYLYSLVSDHWQYYSIVGVIALVVAVGEKICRRWDEGRWPWRMVAGAAVVIVLGVATRTRAGIYAQSETLWQDTVTKNPEAWVAHANLGRVLAKAGKLDGAIGHFERALQLKPEFADAYYNLGVAWERAGNIDKAIGYYEQAVHVEPQYADAHYNLGAAFKDLGKWDDAMAQYQEALRYNPDSTEAHNNLGDVLLRLNRIDEAMTHFNEALHLKPEFPQAHYNLGRAFVLQRNMPQAANEFGEALRLKPDYAWAHYNLGNVLAAQGHAPEAAAHWQRAAELASEQGNVSLADAARARIGHSSSP